MKRFLSVLFALLSPLVATATNLASGEWFLNQDPGIGAGTAFAVAATPTASASVTVPAATLNTLAPGFHLLGTRMLDSEGEWGHVVWRGFHKEEPEPPGPRLLADAEWFIDEDPGVGLGTAITLPATVTGTVKPQIPAATLNSLSDGYHLIGVRTRDNLSRWGPVVWRGFHIDRSPEPPPNIASVEYRIIRKGKIVSTVTKAASPPAASVTLAVNHGKTNLLQGASYLLQVIPMDVTGRRGHAVYADFVNQPYASALALSAGALPTFVSGKTGYALTVPNGVTSTTITTSVTNAATKIKVNGVAIASGANSASIPLAVGANTIKVDIIAEDGKTMTTYTVIVTRAPSSVASLKALALSAGPLSPAFASGTKSYALTVANNVTHTKVTPTVTHSSAKVKVNGVAIAAGSASASIPLDVGKNTIRTDVTAQDGTTMLTYTITITRKASSNALLKHLALKGAKLTPVFGSKKATYTTTVSPKQKSIQIQAVVADPAAKITIAGEKVRSGEMSKPIKLKTNGKTVIKIVVTSQNGAAKTYSVTVFRNLLLAGDS